MYELWIEHKKEGTSDTEYLLADLEDIKPSMTYGVNDIGELQNRNATISMTVKLPRTQQNCRIFNHAHLPDSISNTPYETHNCYLFSNGHTLAGTGSYIIVKKITGKHFETQIKSGIATFFDKIKTHKMNELSLGQLRLGDMSLFLSKNDDFVLPFATYQKKEAQRVVSNFGQYQIPAFFVKRAIERIAGQHGYTLHHNLDKRWEKLAVSLSTLKVVKPLDWYNIKLKLTESELNTFEPSKSFHLIFETKQDNLSLVNIELVEVDSSHSFLGFTIIGCRYACCFTYSGSASFYINLDSNYLREGNVNSISVNARLYDSDGKEKKTVVKKKYNYIDGKINISQTYEIEFEEKETLRFEVIYNSDTKVTSFKTQSSIEAGIKDVQVKIVPPGALLSIADNTGFDTQLDFMKAICQALGVTVNVLESERIVEMYDMNKLYENKSSAFDWTNKLNTEKQETTFTIHNYGQENRVLFQENKDDNIEDTGIFNIENETLTPVKDLFKLPFESGKDNIIERFRWDMGEEKDGKETFTEGDMDVAYKVANIPLFSETIEKVPNEEYPGKITYKFEGGKPHLLIADNGMDLKNNVKREGYVVQHYPAQDIVKDSYFSGDITKMLYHARMLTAEFLLTEDDIERYNQWQENAKSSGAFIPVYLQQTGAYYYINSIKNFQSGKLTKVELIKM